MCKKFILLMSLILMSGLAAAQAQESYIIVHALNPEGVEINSIIGQYVEIFDGEDFIGYTPCNSETHNVPIPIAPGTHTIKAKFNGMELSQNINLQEGETKVITFAFERTEFDLAGWIDGLDFNADLEINREFYLYYPGSDASDFSHTLVEDWVGANLPGGYGGWNPYVGGGAKLNLFGEASASGMYKAIAKVQLSSTGYYEYLFAQSQLWDFQNYCQPEVYSEPFAL